MHLFDRIRAAARAPLAGRPARARAGRGTTPTLERTLARVRPMLATEPVVWLSTVRPDGLPHLVPTWFWWDGEALIVFSKPDAVKVRNLRANPRLMVALGRPDDDFSVGLIEAEAALGAAAVPDAFFAKYAGPARGSRPRSPDLRRDLHPGDPDRPDAVPRLARPRRAGTTPRRAASGRPSPEAPALAFRGTLLPAWA